MDFKVVIFNIIVIILNATLLVRRATEGEYILAVVHLLCIVMMLYAFIALYISTKARKREYERFEQEWKEIFESLEK